MKELLNLPGKDLKEFVSFSLGAYVVKRARIKAPDLSPTDHLIYELIQNCILKGYDLSSLLALADSFQGSSLESTDVARSRMRSRIKKLYELGASKDATIKHLEAQNSAVIAYLKSLGLDLGSELNPEQ